MSQTKRNFHWGIVGPGRIAVEFGSDLHHVPNAVLHSVYARKLDRAETFAKEHGFAHANNDYQAFLADAELDIVYIATPHPTHIELARKAILAGKAVLVEKPVTMTAAEARALDALSLDHDVFAMEAMWSRFLPAIQQAKTIVDSGALGSIIQAEADFRPHRAFDAEDRLFNPALGGGAMHDLGVYPLSILQFLLGPLSLKKARWWPAPTGVDHGADMTLSAGDTIIKAAAGFVENPEDQGDNSLVLYGSKKILRIDPMFHEGRSLTVWDVPLETGTTDDKGQRKRFDRKTVGLNYQAIAVQEAIANGHRQNVMMTLSESATILELIEAVLEPVNQIEI